MEIIIKFNVLALDYDGTIAMNGTLNSDVRVAIEEARAHGIAVVLVTGRILSDLQRAAGGIRLFDAVVAENGAVLAFPNGYWRLLSHAPPPIFLDELRRQGIQFVTGQCVVESDAASASRILSIIRELELPLALLFNRSRLMVLPQAISKGIGLHGYFMCIIDPEGDYGTLESLPGVLRFGGGHLLPKLDDLICPSQAEHPLRNRLNVSSCNAFG